VRSVWGVTPKESILAEVRRSGRQAVVFRCTEVLAGRGIDAEFLFALAGPASRQVLDGREGGPGGHWPKVWALRGLLYAWDDAAEAPVMAATADDSWRVREMAAKVIRANEIDEALEVLSTLVDDPVPRVRTAADRARVALTGAAPRSGQSLRRNGQRSTKMPSPDRSGPRRGGRGLRG
jgi:hypothetical protein